MVTEKLHFRVDPSIINIIRQGYWYEDRKDWAMQCLHSLGGNMTLDMAMDLLNGDNGLKVHSDGINLAPTNEPDLEWKKELAEHKKFLEEQKRKAEEEAKRPYCNNDMSMEIDCKYKAQDGKCLYSKMTGYKTPLTEHHGGECYLDRLGGRQDSFRQLSKTLLGGLDISTEYTIEHVAKKKGDKCVASECEFNVGDVCSFGMRNNWGCHLVDEDVQEKFSEFKMQSMSIGRQGMEGMKFVKHEAQKTFNFKFKGIQFTIKDSARNQGECPHCSHPAPDGSFWRASDKAFLGYKNFGKIDSFVAEKKEDAYAVCFQCPNCKKHFFYHSSYKF